MKATTAPIAFDHLFRVIRVNRVIIVIRFISFIRFMDNLALAWLQELIIIDSPAKFEH